MAYGFSKYMSDQIVNWFKGTAMVASPATSYLALFSADPGETGATGEVSTSGTAYARQAITDSTFWSAITTSGTAEQVTSGSTVTFPTATANWGSVGWAALFDAASVGNCLFIWSFTAQPVNTSNTVSFSTGNLTLQVD